MVKLIIEDDEGKTTVVPLIRDEITIGRKEGNTIRLTERNVSRRHAKLVKHNGALFIEDLNSYNGIKVNGNRISGRVAVAEGDRIQIGDYVLGLKLEGAEKATPDFASGQTVKLPKMNDEALAEAETAVTKRETEAEEEAEEADTEVATKDVGRVVCVSNNFPGHEWLLDKAVMVVGRTDDNDVVINHRSISRHHARITEEHGRYTIVDMQSSNGVRVNGEEYGKVELRRGDLVDLGHVRLRFVAPGEDFVFSRDASIVDITRSGSSKTGLFAAVVVLLLVGAGVVVWRMSRRPVTTGGQGDMSTVAASDTSTKAQPSGPDPSELLASISQAITSESWDQALSACAKLSGEAKANAEANCNRATAEKKAAGYFEALRKASLQNDYAEVIRNHDLIPDSSVYKKRDEKLVQEARDKLVAQWRTDLDAAVRRHDCSQADTLVQQIKKLLPDDQTAGDRAARCRAVAVAPRPRPRPQPKVVKPRPQPKVVKPQPKVVKPQPVSPAQLQQLVQGARDDYMNGRFAGTIKKARQVLRLSPGHPKAVRFIGAAACQLKDKNQAQWAYNRMNNQADRNTLRQVCASKQITLE